MGKHRTAHGFEGIAQRQTEFLGAGLGFLQGQREGLFHRHHGIVGMAGKLVAAAHAIDMVVFLGEVQGELFRRMAVGQLFRRDHRA